MAQLQLAPAGAAMGSVNAPAKAWWRLQHLQENPLQYKAISNILARIVEYQEERSPTGLTALVNFFREVETDKAYSTLMANEEFQLPISLTVAFYDKGMPGTAAAELAMLRSLLEKKP